MSLEAEIVGREKQFWIGSLEIYERWMTREVKMIFPAPVGILDRDQVLNGIRAGSRWQSVEMFDLSFQLIGGSAVVLAYRARARKPDMATDYHVLVGSVYVSQDSEWKLAFHQHTPVSQRENEQAASGAQPDR